MIKMGSNTILRNLHCRGRPKEHLDKITANHRTDFREVENMNAKKFTMKRDTG